jgi:hypothetical protein
MSWILLMIFWCFVDSFLPRMKLDPVSVILLLASKKFPKGEKRKKLDKFLGFCW